MCWAGYTRIYRVFSSDTTAASKTIREEHAESQSLVYPSDMCGSRAWEDLLVAPRGPEPFILGLGEGGAGVVERVDMVQDPYSGTA